MDPQLPSAPNPHGPSSPSKPQPLAELSPNKASPTKPTAKLQQLSEMCRDENATHQHHHHHHHCQNQSEQTTNQTYVSPSDTLLSPTTKKLSQIKGRRFAAAKPQSLSLFAKALGKQALRSDDTDAGAAAGSVTDAARAEK